MATAEGTADAFAPPAGMWFQRLSAGSHLLHVVLQRSEGLEGDLVHELGAAGVRHGSVLQGARGR